MARRYYSSAAAETTLTGSITSGATSITVGSVTGHPVQYPYTLILDRDSASEEVVEVTAGSGTNLTVTRGVDGTTALAHTAGASVIHGVSARDFDEPNEHVNKTSGTVHGLDLASVATKTGAETLTNKTIDGDLNTLQDIPASAMKAEAWTTFSSAILQSSNSNGNWSTNVGRYKIVGKTCFWSVAIIRGGVDPVGQISVVLPFAVPDHGPAVNVGSFAFRVGGTDTWYVGSVIANALSSEGYLYAADVNGVINQAGATGDTVYASGSFELA